MFHGNNIRDMIIGQVISADTQSHKQTHRRRKRKAILYGPASCTLHTIGW